MEASLGYTPVQVESHVYRYPLRRT